MHTKNSLHTISGSAVEGDIALHVDLTAAQMGYMISGKAELAGIKASCAAPGHLTTTFVNRNTANNFCFRVEYMGKNNI